MFISETIVRCFERYENSVNEFREDMGFIACDGETIVPVNFPDPGKHPAHFLVYKVEISDLSYSEHAKPSVHDCRAHGSTRDRRTRDDSPRALAKSVYFGDRSFGEYKASDKPVQFCWQASHRVLGAIIRKRG